MAINGSIGFQLQLLTYTCSKTIEDSLFRECIS